VVVCEGYRDEGVAPTGECLHFVGAPPSGRWVVVCEGYRDEGVAPTGKLLAFCGSPALGAMGGGLPARRAYPNPHSPAPKGGAATCGPKKQL
jgi:hypothetical protein